VQVSPSGQSLGEEQPAIGSHLSVAIVDALPQAGPTQRHALRALHSALVAPTHPHSVGLSSCQTPLSQVASSVAFALHGAGYWQGVEGSQPAPRVQVEPATGGSLGHEGVQHEPPSQHIEVDVVVTLHVSSSHVAAASLQPSFDG
jgi:hypothetical protein